MEIEGRVAFITGAKRIGKIVGAALGKRGARIALSYNRSRESAEETAREVRAAGQEATVIRADLSRGEDVSKAVSQITKVWGGIDILINLASIYSAKPLEETTQSDWDHNMNVNLRSAFLCAQAVTPWMRARGAGRIINCADWTAASGRPRYKGYLPYYVSKVGVVGLTEALALELAPYNILVNAIAPGPILPPPDLTQDEVEKVRAVTPLGRWGGAEQIAAAAISLIESDFITGECIRIDGGRHIH